MKSLVKWAKTYTKIASSRLTVAHGAVAAPLCIIALWNKSLDNGDNKCNETETAPALSPNNVIRAGSGIKCKTISLNKNINQT